MWLALVRAVFKHALQQNSNDKSVLGSVLAGQDKNKTDLKLTKSSYWYISVQSCTDVYIGKGLEILSINDASSSHEQKTLQKLLYSPEINSNTVKKRNIPFILKISSRVRLCQPSCQQILSSCVTRRR